MQEQINELENEVGRLQGQVVGLKLGIYFIFIAVVILILAFSFK